MPYYKTTSGEVHFIDSAEFEHLLPDSCVQITEAEADELRKPPKKTVRDQIAEMESQQTPRRIREALLSGDHSFIESIEAQIAALRTQLS